ncbi:MAG: hypothetical protein V4642_04125 [Bacteroidota bacterium]
MQLTKAECDILAEEMQEIILRIFEKDTYKIVRLHTIEEQNRLEEIAHILKECEIID